MLLAWFGAQFWLLDGGNGFWSSCLSGNQMDFNGGGAP